MCSKATISYWELWAFRPLQVLCGRPSNKKFAFPCISSSAPSSSYSYVFLKSMSKIQRARVSACSSLVITVQLSEPRAESSAILTSSTKFSSLIFKALGGNAALNNYVLFGLLFNLFCTGIALFFPVFDGFHPSQAGIHLGQEKK